MQRGPGFFGTLFDVSFQHFLTLRFVKVIYVLLMVIILGSGLGAMIFGVVGALRAGSGQQALVSILGALVVTPLVTLLWLTVVRLVLESIVVFFRLNETTTELLYANRAIVRHLVAPSRPAHASGTMSTSAAVAPFSDAPVSSGVEPATPFATVAGPAASATAATAATAVTDDDAWAAAPAAVSSTEPGPTTSVTPDAVNQADEASSDGAVLDNWASGAPTDEELGNERADGSEHSTDPDNSLVNAGHAANDEVEDEVAWDVEPDPVADPTSSFLEADAAVNDEDSASEPTAATAATAATAPGEPAESEASAGPAERHPLAADPADLDD